MLDRLLYIVLGLCGVLVLAFALYFCQFGLDYTDESFYIHWITDPSAWSIHVPLTFFGFVYHPFFVLLDGDIVLLRQLNVLFIFVLAGFFSYATMRMHLNFPRRIAASFALALAATALACFRIWAVSPSYNTLAFEGLMIALTGLVLSASPHRRIIWSAWTLVAIGGWLAFMGKPTTAALLGPAVLAYLYILKIRQWGYAGYAAALAGILTAGSLLAIDHGSIRAVITRISDSLEAVRLLGSGQTIRSVIRIDWPDLSLIDWGMVAFGCAIVAGFAQMAVRHAKPWVQDVFCLLIVVTGAVLLFTGLRPFDFDGVEQIGFVLAALGACLWLIRTGTQIIWRQDLLALAAVLFFAPYFYAFGTNGNYWDAGAEVCFFWGLAAIVLMWPAAQTQAGIRVMLPLMCLALFFGMAQLNKGLMKPFRQPEPLRAMTAPVPVAGSFIIKAKGFADYDQALRDITGAGGFLPGMPLIDLTGRSPGVLYDLKAKALGQPWMVGRYEGSNEFAVFVLERESCADIAKAWLLAEPDGPRHLNGAMVMAAFGADINRDYAKTKDIRTPEGAGGYTETYTQYFLKPTRPFDKAVSACEKARGQKQE